jgi:hypothetical protein
MVASPSAVERTVCLGKVRQILAGVGKWPDHLAVTVAVYSIAADVAVYVRRRFFTRQSVDNRQFSNGALDLANREEAGLATDRRGRRGSRCHRSSGCCSAGESSVPPIEKALLIVGISITVLASMGMGLQAYSWRHGCGAVQVAETVDAPAARSFICE